MGCLVGCFRLLFTQIWRLIAAALIAMLLTRIDDYVARRHGGNVAGRAWRAYRGRGDGAPRA